MSKTKRTARGEAGAGGDGAGRLPLALIACVGRNRAIGLRGRLPWRSAEDLAHFRVVTMGHALVMGRVTFESLPGPLAGRKVIVLSRKAEYAARNGIVAHSLDEAIRVARATDAEPIVCGGATVYAEALPLVTRLYLTEIARDFEGDAFFPRINEADWRETDRRRVGELAFRTLERAG